MSTLRHIAGDRWEVRVYDPTRKSGKRARSFRANGIASAKRKVAAVEAQLRAEVDGDKARAGTVADMAEKWLTSLDSLNWAPGTRTVYERHAKSIIEHLGHIRADQLRPVDVNEWLQKVAARPGRMKGTTVAPITVRHHRATLIAMMGEAERSEQIPTARAARNSASVKVKDRQKTTPTDEVMALLLETASPTLRAIVAVVVFAGLREGEVAGLRWSDITLSAPGRNGVVRVRRQVVRTKGALLLSTPKSDAGVRDVEVAPALDAYLAVLPRPRGGDGFVFPDWRDASGQTPRGPDAIGHSWAHHRNKMGAPGVRFHDIRHWHMTALHQSGVALESMRKRAGHASATTTMIYAGTDAAADAAAAGVIGDRLALPAPE
jgi:integrase